MEALKIPDFIRKLAITGVVVFLSALFGFIAYNYLMYKIWKPYFKYIDIDCKIKNNSTVIILTAKSELKNITIYDPNDRMVKVIKSLSKDSSDLVYVKYAFNPNYVQVEFRVNNNTYRAVSECKEEVSLLQKLLK